jgi:DNA repair ATPase RecN
VPSSRLDEFEKRVMKGESLLQILEVIFDMFMELMRHIDSKVSLQKHCSTSNLLKAPEKEIEDSMSPEERYSNLEKLLQKYEAQIRDHIRVEQQLKIYVENMQEGFTDKENQLKEALNISKKTLAVNLFH